MPHASTLRGASWACKLARAYLPAADAPSPREAPATLPSSRAALVARLSTAVPASAVDFHISNVLDGALAQPEVRHAAQDAASYLG